MSVLGQDLGLMHEKSSVKEANWCLEVSSEGKRVKWVCFPLHYFPLSEILAKQLLMAYVRGTGLSSGGEGDKHKECGHKEHQCCSPTVFSPVGSSSIGGASLAKEPVAAGQFNLVIISAAPPYSSFRPLGNEVESHLAADPPPSLTNKGHSSGERMWDTLVALRINQLLSLRGLANTSFPVLDGRFIGFAISSVAVPSVCCQI